MKINVKFASHLTEQDMAELAASIRALGVTAVRPLHPEPDDEELRRLFIVDADDAKPTSKLLDQIRKIPGVEFAHLPAQRKLVR